MNSAKILEKITKYPIISKNLNIKKELMKKITLKIYINTIMLFETESTEDKIITATFHILQREGVQKATTKKIAAEAGVNEVTIFRKFDNKKKSNRNY